MTRAFFNEQREVESAGNLKNLRDYKRRHREWINYLWVIDLILKLIPAANNKYTSVKVLSIPQSRLSQGQREVARLVMGKLLELKLVIDSPSPSKVVTTSDPIRNLFFGSKFLVNDRDRLLDYREAVERISAGVLQLGKSRFPKDYGVVYYIEFLKTRQILINGEHLLAKPNFNSVNEKFFDYMYHHPNVRIPVAQLMSETQLKLGGKSIGSIVNDLGFKNELKQLFFPDVSKTAVKFNNYIEHDDDSLHYIDKTNLKNMIKTLSKIA